MENWKISVSEGNIKMGPIKSVSLPAAITCRPDAPCLKLCYALRMESRRKNIKDAYERNLEILKNSPVDYWRQVNAAMLMERYFRLHVSGDIPDREYFVEMIKAARRNKHCQILCFTKRWDICDDVIEKMKQKKRGLPKNLHLIYSAWGSFRPENPHNLPVASVIFRNTAPDPAMKICGGNCTECACRGVGCWALKNGETLGLYEH